MVCFKRSLPALLLASVCAANPGCWRTVTCSFPTEASFSGPWDANIYAPDTRNPKPRRILSFETRQEISTYPGTPVQSTLKGNGSALVFDYGVLTGGVTSIKYTLTGDAAKIGLAFTEAKDYIGYVSDSSNGNYRGPDLGQGATLISQDGALYKDAEAGSGTFEPPWEVMRAGFRYLTVYILTNGTSELRIDDVGMEIVFQPTWSNLRAYQGYFRSSDEELNKIWYSGAYTLQTNAAPPETGRASTSVIKNGGWLNNATLGVGESLLLDGAKRDRWVWPGDMGVATPSAFYSTGDLESVRNALQTLFDLQDDKGNIPRNGPPSKEHTGDVYHMWAMIGTYNYFLYSGDQDFLNANWAKFVKAMDFIYGLVKPDGILAVAGDRDWARYINVNNGSSQNMMLYRTLTTGAYLFEFAPPDPSNSTNLTTAWLERAESLRTAIFANFWDESKGAFIDGWKNKTLYPQDSNSYALAFGVAKPGSREAERVSKQLTENWTPIGPANPELPGNISPFISSIELEGHFAVGRPDRALRLIHDSWGWYLNHPNGTQSTVVEGYLVDGSWGYRSTRGYTNDPPYVSHAHGWSSGPTSTLTEYLVGIRVTRPAGAGWELKPAFGFVAEAQAGFTTTKGKFSAKYKVEGKTAVVEWDTPVGTRGWVDLGREKRWVEGGKGSLTVEVNKFCIPRRYKI